MGCLFNQSINQSSKQAIKGEREEGSSCVWKSRTVERNVLLSMASQCDASIDLNHSLFRKPTQDV